MTDQQTPSVIPPTPSAADYVTDSHGKPLIPDASDPISLFQDWMAAAREHELNDSNAMSLATVDASGLPDVRIVLLKAISADGLTFFTNFKSAKGHQLSDNPVAAVCFHWKSMRRQVRFRGAILPVPDEAADVYFASRAKDSRIGAIASKQSQPLPSRETFEDRIKALQAQYEGTDDVPRPENWGGYRLVPESIEFWQDQAFRMHDRLKFVRTEDGWSAERLYP
ncbi:pyridoxamine 5'-phosphate oxidase [Henriciella litoralis]|uniref:pyridoxamine 5'-phosphate oxidase n=1 Tax=Henriciella litoralis TaxID=568102 RepID=UPI000A019A3A|nr:pyridoxamine 5'-phosphate oxidase [Henriciella litoralis]